MSNDKVNSSRQSREKSKEKDNNKDSYNRDCPSEYWGHKIGKKRRHTTRVCFVNINGIGMKNKSKKNSC